MANNDIGVFQTPPATPPTTRAAQTVEQGTQTDYVTVRDQPKAPWMYVLLGLAAWTGLGWVVGLAGLAGLNDDLKGENGACSTYNLTTARKKTVAVPLCVPGEGQYGYFYFAFVLQLLCCLGIGVAVYWRQLGLYRTALNTLLIMATAIIITCCDACLTLASLGDSAVSSSAGACSAGTIMLLLANFTLFLYLCAHETSRLHALLYGPCHLPKWNISLPKPIIITVPMPPSERPTEAPATVTAPAAPVDGQQAEAGGGGHVSVGTST